MRIRIIETDRRRRRLRGFTLIELVTAAAIIAILAAIAYPSYVEHVRRSRRVEAIAALSELMQRQERHYSQQNTYFAFSRQSNPSNHKWYSGTAAAASSHEIEARPCPGRTLTACVELVATPGTDSVDRNYADPACGDLSLASDGSRRPSQPACWR